MDKDQKQTTETFSFKWKKRDTYEGSEMQTRFYNWLVDRYFGSESARIKFLEEIKDKSLLDAGCGSGYSATLLFGEYLNTFNYLGVDISDSIDVAKERFREKGYSWTGFLQENIQTMKLNSKFDIIFCEGVIHHSTKPFETFCNLTSHLEHNGIIMFYVYKEKAPIREFCDDFIRDKLKGFDNETAWEKLLPLSKLGKALGELEVDVNIAEDIEVLGIPKGKYSVQRFVYWFLFKAYYDKNISIDEMNHINFDWYRPVNCHRFSQDEISEWLVKTGMQKVRFVVEMSGITVVARKN